MNQSENDDTIPMEVSPAELAGQNEAAEEEEGNAS